MKRLSLVSLCLLLAACAGPPKDVGALSDGSGSGSSDESSSGEDSASMSTTTAATTQSTTAVTTVDETTMSTTASDDVGTDTSPYFDLGGTGDCECQGAQFCSPIDCVGGQVFLNFDGPTMIGGFDDSTMDSTSIAELTGPMQPHGGDATERAAVLEAVRARFTAVDLWITDERPENNEYRMIVLGDNLGAIGPVLEISPVNCGGANERTVAFVAAYAGDDLDLETTATVIAHAIGHTAGLDHVDDAGSIMAQLASPDATFSAGCAPLVEGAAACGAQHMELCGAGQQDALGELQELFDL